MKITPSATAKEGRFPDGIITPQLSKSSIITASSRQGSRPFTRPGASCLQIVVPPCHPGGEIPGDLYVASSDACEADCGAFSTVAFDVKIAFCHREDRAGYEIMTDAA